MFCLLQLYPPKALDHGEGDEPCLDVIAVDRSRVALEEFLEAYEPRYRAACDEFQSWDRDKSAEWTWLIPLTQVRLYIVAMPV